MFGVGKVSKLVLLTQLGFEPGTSSIEGNRSTNWATVPPPPKWFKIGQNIKLKAKFLEYFQHFWQPKKYIFGQKFYTF